MRWIVILCAPLAFVGCGGNDGDGSGAGDGGAKGDGGRTGAGDGGSTTGSGSGGMPGLQPYTLSCGTFCDARQQAGCADTEASSECESLCLDNGGLEDNCAVEFATLVNCSNSAPMQCNGRDEPVVTVDCSNQSEEFDRCMMRNGWISTSFARCDVYSCQGICDSVFGCVECAMNEDCGPTEQCMLRSGVCRQRCLGDEDCPGAFCSFSDVCGDPVGTSCERGVGCEGGRCIDVDANLTTVDPYCSILCLDVSECPQGYACQQNECRRL